MKENTFFSLRRTRAILLKEFRQLIRDRVTLRMIVLIPIMQLLLFGYALNTDPKNLPTAVLTQDNGPYVRSIIAGFQNTGYFSVLYRASSEIQARQMLQEGKVQFVINIPAYFNSDLVRGKRPKILLEVDATDPVATSSALAAVGNMMDTVLRRELKGTLAAQQNGLSPIDLRIHRLYNPEGFTRYNIIPGLIAIILTMTGIMMTTLAITRERERGTIENLLAMPVRPIEVMFGKITPYVMIGFMQSAIILLASKYLLDIPIIGSLWLFFGSILVFISCNMAIGFTLSAAAQNQTQAMQMSMMVTLPSIMFSGFMFPFRGMPFWAQVIGSAMPTTHFIRISRGVLLKGSNFNEIWNDFWPLLLFMVVITMIAIKRYRQTLD